MRANVTQDDLHGHVLLDVFAKYPNLESEFPDLAAKARKSLAGACFVQQTLEAQEDAERDRHRRHERRANGKGAAHDAPPSVSSSTDVGNAERLVQRHGGMLRYCWPWQKWLIWDGKRWAIDTNGTIFRLAKETVKAIATEEAKAATEDSKFTALLSWSRQSLNSSRIHAMVDLARSEPGIPVQPEHLDQHPWLLNVQNGTLDLRTCELHPHRKAEYITKLAPVSFNPEATCPTWLAFLEKILPSEPLRQFIQKAVGRSLTGDTSEKILHVCYGSGDNGKTTFLETLEAVLGTDYAVRTPTETLLVKKHDGIPNDIAKLKGARLVYASEAEQGRRLAESLIKDLTGGDTIPARFMHGEWFTFRPEFKLWLGTNHKPVIRGTDKAIWNRVKLIPFAVTIPEAQQDKQLKKKLLTELDGILLWAVEGCQQWQVEGLNVPDEVKDATDGYRNEMDELGNFITTCCELGPYYQVKTSDLFAAYVTWSGEKDLKQNAFARLLTDRGFDVHNHRWRKGIRLVSESEE